MPKKKRPSTPSPKPEQGPNPPPKRKRGRPPEDSRFVPTQEQRTLVEAGCGLGIPEDQLVRVVINPDTGRPIASNTLRKHFRAELDRGLIQTKMRVGGALVRNALGVPPTEHHPGHPGNVTAQIFYLKTQAGWKEGEPPAPPVSDDDQVDLQDAGRRIAFALAVAERAPKKALPAPDKPKAKSREPA